MATKFVRSLIFKTNPTNTRASNILKFMYEFWGFCVFGGTSLTNPGSGAFASTSPFGGGLPGNFNGVATTISASSNGVSLPQSTINVVSTTNFPTSGTIYVYTSAGTQTVTYTGVTSNTFTGCSGGTGTMSTGNNVTSSSLLTIGNDGYTNATTDFRYDGYQDFFATSGPFTENMVGKQIVIWKNNSGSSEDSIYNIIAYKSPTNIVVNVNNGGTPSAADGYKPSFTTRSSINYRVIDVNIAGSTTGIGNGNYIVFQLDPTGINSGQSNPQIQFIIAGTSANTRLDFKISPNGSWNGTSFGTDASGTLSPNTVNSSDFFNAASNSTGFNILLIGDKDFMIGQFKDANGNNGTYGVQFHFEIPERLYSSTQDPNPIAVNINGWSSSGNYFESSNSSRTYGGGFVMRDSSGTYRNYKTAVRALTGDGNAATAVASANIPGNNLTDYRSGINSFTGNMLNSRGFLCLPGVPGQYSLARVALRRCRFANIFMPTFTRFSSGGNDFILLTQGVAVPWDKTILPYTLFPF
jgi:hypothetical protein